MRKRTKEAKEKSLKYLLDWYRGIESVGFEYKDVVFIVGNYSYKDTPIFFVTIESPDGKPRNRRSITKDYDGVMKISSIFHIEMRFKSVRDAVRQTKRLIDKMKK